MFKEKLVDANAAIEKLDSTFRLPTVEADPYLKSLKALSTAAKLYRTLSESTVDVRILQQSLYKSAWAESSYRPSSVHYLSLKNPKSPELSKIIYWIKHSHLLVSHSLTRGIMTLILGSCRMLWRCLQGARFTSDLVCFATHQTSRILVVSDEFQVISGGLALHIMCHL